MLEKQILNLGQSQWSLQFSILLPCAATKMDLDLHQDKNLQAEAVHVYVDMRPYVSIQRAATNNIEAALLLWDNDIKKTNNASTKGLNWWVCMCVQRHTCAMKITCSAAFNSTCYNLHLCSFIPIKSLEFNDTPGCHHASGVLKNAGKGVNRGISCGWDGVGHHYVVLIRDTAASVSQGTGWGWHFSLQVNCAAQI